MGTIERYCLRTEGGAELTVKASFPPPDDLSIGDSIAINGVCLTIVNLRDGGMTFEVSGETLSCTTLSGLAPGERINLERALLATARLGGHIVSGHVDGIGELVGMAPVGESVVMDIRVSDALSRYIAGKGSITIDGVSLTVNRVSGQVFSVNIIPHTLAETTLGMLRVGSRLNIEIDIIARYLERLIGHDEPGARRDGSLAFGVLD